jgi:demethylspheroidene O-methyltransferase
MASSALLDRLRDLRNRIIASPRFRRAAARSAITAPVARRETRALFDLAAGFVYSQVLAAFVRLDLVTLLAAGPVSTGSIAEATGLDRDRAERLMRAAVSLRLAEGRGDDRFALGALGAALVGNDGVTAMIAHHDMLYRDLSDPLAVLRGDADTETARFWAYGGDEGAASAYSDLMASSQAFIASEILDALPLGACRRLVDVGGGDGTFARAVAARHPTVDLVIFDLPAVARRARRTIDAAGAGARVTVEAGDFLAGPLPRGGDIVTLNRVLHDHDDAAAMKLLRNVHDALEPGGRAFVCEPMAGTRGAEPAGDAYFGFYFLAMGQGRPRRAGELAAMLQAAGFHRVREHRTATPLLVRILSAQKPIGRQKT